mgnify:CR=1 FL=1
MILNLYLQELRLFIRNFTEWAILFLVFTVFFFTFGLKEVIVADRVFSLPLPSNPSFAAELFNYMTLDLIPEGVTLVVTSPLTAFVVQVKMALLLAFIFTLPFFLYRLIQYLSPALYAREKIATLKVVAPSALLFLIGARFSYTVIIPPTFAVLYSYSGAIGATPFFTANEFAGLVLALIVASGIMFLMPVCMILLSRLGVVSPDFWKSQWRYAILLFLITSAIITPDGSGVTMMLLSAPMAGLYGIGYIVSRKLGAAPAMVEVPSP